MFKGKIYLNKTLFTHSISVIRTFKFIGVLTLSTLTLVKNNLKEIQTTLKCLSFIDIFHEERKNHTFAMLSFTFYFTQIIQWYVLLTFGAMLQ